jgi:hypothetical protein
MSEPCLDGSDGNPCFYPASRTRLAEAMQIEMLANGVIPTGNLHPFLLISPNGNRRFTLAAVQPCSRSDAFQLS